MSPSLTSEIQDAFRDTEPPGADAISVPTYDDEGTQNHFSGTRWQDHSVRTLENYTFSLECFTPQAFAYYLPAFMLVALEGTAPGVTDSLVRKLCPPKNNPMRPSYMSWWR